MSIPDLQQRINLLFAFYCIQLQQQCFLGFAQLPQLQHRFGPDAEVVEHLTLHVIQLAWLVIDNAECANIVSLWVAQRLAGVKTDARAGCHQWVVGKARIFAGIINNEQFITENGMAAEGNVASCFSHRQANAGFEPLAIKVYQRHQCNRHLKQMVGDAGDAVKHLFVRCVQQQHASQRF